MANQKLIHLRSFLFLLINIQSTIATTEVVPQPPKQVEKTTDVVVEGLIFCQSCDYYGTWSLNKSKPIESATISVICKNHKNRVIYYKTCKTDKNGYFYAQLKGFKPSNSFLDHPLHACKVRLVASPLPTCNFLTNVNYGLSGAPLRYEDKRITASNYEAVVYAAGPLAFRPAHCSVMAEGDL